jgi:hypothetical protein
LKDQEFEFKLDRPEEEKQPSISQSILDPEDSVFDSTIITSAQEQSFVIKHICQGGMKSLDLLYRGSMHSFDAKACHFKVNGNANTVTFIQAEDGLHE